jgi:hypothetical protein
MRKKLLVIIGLVTFVLISSVSDGWCKGIIYNVRSNLSKDRHGYTVNANWDINYKHWKYDFNTITRKAGVWMDCVSTYDRKGYTYKKVIGSACLPGLSKKRSGAGTLSCHLSKRQIPGNGRHMWVRIKVKIAGRWENPIWVYAGRIR